MNPVAKRKTKLLEKEITNKFYGKSLMGTKVFFEGFKTIIKSRQAVEEELERARTSKKPMVIKQNRLSVPALSLGLRVVDEITTYFRTTSE